MSWISTSILIVLIALGCSYALSEWIVKRRASGSDDAPPLG
jgi:hypothetical protein